MSAEVTSVQVNLGFGVVEARDVGDVDLDVDDVRLADGERLTEDHAEALSRDIQRRLGPEALAREQERLRRAG